MKSARAMSHNNSKTEALVSKRIMLKVGIKCAFAVLMALGKYIAARGPYRGDLFSRCFLGIGRGSVGLC